MSEPFPESWYAAPDTGRTLPTYFLGTVPMTTFLPWQRRLAFDVSGPDHPGALVVCEHAPAITVGRDGSRVHIRLSPQDLQDRGWPVTWVPRGGGVLLHQPGQISLSLLLKFEALNMTAAAYRDAFQDAVVEVLALTVPNITTHAGRAGLFVKGRLLAHTGLAIREGITRFGITVNAAPDLEPFGKVWVDSETLPMTSVEREATHRVRVTTLRQQLAESIARRFGFAGLSVFHHHPALRLHDSHAAPR